MSPRFSTKGLAGTTGRAPIGCHCMPSWPCARLTSMALSCDRSSSASHGALRPWMRRLASFTSTFEAAPSTATCSARKGRVGEKAPDWVTTSSERTGVTPAATAMRTRRARLAGASASQACGTATCGLPDISGSRPTKLPSGRASPARTKLVGSTLTGKPCGISWQSFE